MMTDKDIQFLKEQVKNGENVCYIDDDGKRLLVSSVNLNWVEFPDEPDLKEPAAMLVGSVPVALLNVELSSFMKLVPLK